MASILTGKIPFHHGEKKMHNLLRVPSQDNPTVPSLGFGAAYLLRTAPLLAIGSLDQEGRPWSTVWGGEAGFANPITQSTIEVNTPVDTSYDPVVRILLHDFANDPTATSGNQKIWSGLIVDLETRRRAKLHGKGISGSLDPADQEEIPGLGHTGTAHLTVHIDASLGNCPKYLNKKRIIPTLPAPKLISNSPQLSSEGVSLLDRADCLFVSSSHGSIDMDTNIRGGPPGFVRLVSNEPSGAVFAYPEYSGNRLYQTLGNLQANPLAGYVFPDFDNGAALYITGQTQILIGKDAARVLPRSNLAVLVTITAARYVEKSLSFRGIAGEPSPYNPPVRYLAAERDIPTVPKDDGSAVTATLIKKDILTPAICRFRFRISDPAKLGKWVPGQYATFSFHDELDMGYRHMQDDDPTSLNDDYIRTFTISSYPGQGLGAAEFEITARKHGNVTNYLFRTNERAGLEVPLKGFGGNFQIQKGRDHIVPFIAGGIGITPILAQLPALDTIRLRLLWSVSVHDMGLVLDTFQRFPRLSGSTTLFVTGADPQDKNVVEQYQAVCLSEARIYRRRMDAKDLDSSLADMWYFCGSPSLKGSVLTWLTGKNVVFEDFNY
ncbi:putative oxidoreductase, FAD-binding [Aspergillus ibericus CBS 121593]|uniref:Oxidoreductase FAD-binding protein n=1 Tax=Aspergillus ibericus CBS 121593 TaxID=1448316 RepID=A0A395GQT6_9EURO|nr:oxidoreductase FAD-binding protein [Aspergillus ibericus CBS 121593]RAK97756.1 oxidoreductase FAD-binding protein [Aspergillus ibericus CBS 121593]